MIQGLTLLTVTLVLFMNPREFTYNYNLSKTFKYLKSKKYYWLTLTYDNQYVEQIILECVPPRTKHFFGFWSFQQIFLYISFKQVRHFVLSFGFTKLRQDFLIIRMSAISLFVWAKI